MARHERVHLATTILPYYKPKERPYLIAAEIVEVRKPAQREATVSHSEECTRAFHACPTHYRSFISLICSSHVNVAYS